LNCASKLQITVSCVACDGRSTLRTRAFTLIEVLIALVVLSLGFLAVLQGSTFSLRSSRESTTLTTAVIAAESLLKEEISKGFPASGSDEGTFEDGVFEGFTWAKRIEELELPFIEELKLVTVTISWGSGKEYTLQTVLSRY
jgi:prepilin-type N-terminal cleavage/methylation domain-containing protein